MSRIDIEKWIFWGIDEELGCLYTPRRVVKKEITLQFADLPRVESSWGASERRDPLSFNSKIY